MLLLQVPTWLFCTIDGTIGLLASLSPSMFELLNRLQVGPLGHTLVPGKALHWCCCCVPLRM